jgi:cytochrome c556
MSKRIALSVLTLSISAAGLAMAGHEDLPAGPIHDRHELMERIGDNAKKIGDSLKAGNLEPVPAAANEIKSDAGKALALFPKGSTHPKSRAKDEIWASWDEFERLMKQLEAKAGDLATAAANKGDVGAASKAMFGNCKSCHDDFRKPEEKEAKS